MFKVHSLSGVYNYQHCLFYADELFDYKRVKIASILGCELDKYYKYNFMSMQMTHE